MTSRTEKTREPDVVSTEGQIGESRRVIKGVNKILYDILGTTNQVNVTTLGDKIILSTPQNIDLNADVQFDSAILDDLTALRLVSANASKKIISIDDLTAWLAGTADEITVTDDGDGTATIGLVHPVLLREPVLDWHDPTAGLPVAPTVGDRYISEATANGWTQDYIYEWDGSAWVESVPEEGWAVWDLFSLILWMFFSGGWMAINNVEDGAAQGQMLFWDASAELWSNTETSELFWDDTNKRLGILTASPTARLHLPAGTTTAGTAALKLTEGALLTTQEPGTFAYSGGKLYFTNVANRKVIDRTSDVALTTVTVADTTTETTIWTGPMAANSLRAGNFFKFHADGIVSNGGPSAADQITIRVKVGGVTVVSLTPATRSMPVGSHWHISANATQRTIGASGSRAVHIDVDMDSVTTEFVAVAAIDTTANMDVTITVQWASAAEDNTISLYQGAMEYKN